jgi:hypothetical protein
MFPFEGVGGICGDNSCNFFLLLFMVLWVPVHAHVVLLVINILGYNCRDALQEGSADAVACLRVPRACARLGRFLPCYFLFAWWFALLFRLRNAFSIMELK